MRRLMSALCPTTTLTMEPPSAQSPFAQCWHYLHQGGVNRLLREHYSPVIALTGSFVDPTRSPLLWPKPRSRSLCRLRPAPAAGGTLGTTFYFVTGGIEEALKLPKQAAGDKDVKIGGGVSTVRQYLQAGLIDSLHFALAPVALGQGEALLTGLDLPALGVSVTEHEATEHATHAVLEKLRI